MGVVLQTTFEFCNKDQNATGLEVVTEKRTTDFMDKTQKTDMTFRQN